MATEALLACRTVVPVPKFPKPYILHFSWFSVALQQAGNGE
jgi:hypothetical protein